jgi:hypothetical protein
MGFELYLIEILNYSAENVYGYKDDRTIRVFQIATLDWIIGRDETRCNQLPRSPHRFDSIYDVVLR